MHYKFAFELPQEQQQRCIHRSCIISAPKTSSQIIIDHDLWGNVQEFNNNQEKKKNKITVPNLYRLEEIRWIPMPSYYYCVPFSWNQLAHKDKTETREPNVLEYYYQSNYHYDDHHIDKRSLRMRIHRGNRSKSEDHSMYLTPVGASSKYLTISGER